MNIAIVNWRDPWHPAAGGAEEHPGRLPRRRLPAASPPPRLRPGAREEGKIGSA
ncbi:hypothetical protein [Nonomuraea sp. NPDC003201]